MAQVEGSLTAYYLSSCCCGTLKYERENVVPLATTTPSDKPAKTSDIPVFLTGKGSGMVMECEPRSTNPVVINPYDGNNDNQKWLLTHSGVVGYNYIQNVAQGEVLTCSSAEGDKVYLTPKKPSLDNSQLWILRDPDSTGNNPCFVITNVITGYALSVAH